MAAQRLSQRRGKAQPDGPYDGVPVHMRHGLIHWFDADMLNIYAGGRSGNERIIRELASFMRMDVEPGWRAETVANALIGKAEGDEKFFLDLVDGALQLHGHELKGKRLVRLLDTAGSVWTVAEDYKSLVRS